MRKELDAPHRRWSASTWRASVLEEADRLQAMTLRLASHDELILEALDDARTSADWRQAYDDQSIHKFRRARLLGRRMRAWFTGVDIERAWRSLHRARQALMMLLPPDELAAEIPSLRSKLVRHFKKNDPERVSYEKWLAEMEHQPRQLSAVQLRTVREAVDRQSDMTYESLRRFRNTLYGLTVALTIALIVLVFDPPQSPWLPICKEASQTQQTETTKEQPAPSGEETAAPDCATVWHIMALGGLGGLLSAFAALSRIPVATQPYGVRIGQAILKLPAGAAFGLVGVMLMQSSVFDTVEPQGAKKILVYAVIFGYSQQLVTRLLDRKAADLLPSESDGAGS